MTIMHDPRPRSSCPDSSWTGKALFFFPSSHHDKKVTRQTNKRYQSALLAYLTFPLPSLLPSLTLCRLSNPFLFIRRSPPLTSFHFTPPTPSHSLSPPSSTMFSVLRMKTRTRELFKSYCKDWTLVVIVLVAFSIVDQLEPFHRQFSVRDITIQHPFAKQETVPVWLLLVSLFGT